MTDTTPTENDTDESPQVAPEAYVIAYALAMMGLAVVTVAVILS